MNLQRVSSRSSVLSKGIRVLGWVALSTLSLVLGSCASQQQAAGPPPQPPPAVTVTPVRQLAIADSTKYVGRTESMSFVDLRARVPGFLMKQLFEEGSPVREGQLLYVIEQEPYQAAVQMAEAALTESEASLQTAEKYLARLQSVKDTGGASKTNIESAEGNMLQGKAVVQERKAQLTQANLNLGYTEIRAPINGRIGRTAIHVGNLVGPESGVLATIFQLDPIWVSFPISERDYLHLETTAGAGRRTGGAIASLIPTIQLVDGSDFPYKGRIDFQDNQIDKKTGTIMLRATFPNPQLLLRPGQFVTVIQTERAARSRLLVPQAAVQRDQVGAFVFTVDPEKKAVVRRVKLGEESGSDWIVNEGLKEGELVISEGVQKVTPGGLVNPVAATPEAKEGQPSDQ